MRTHANNVVPLRRTHPKTFTAPEAFIDRVAELIITDGRPYKVFAAGCHLSATTVQRLASRQTRWPRSTTLFPILKFMRVGMTITPLE